MLFGPLSVWYCYGSSGRLTHLPLPFPKACPVQLSLSVSPLRVEGEVCVIICIRLTKLCNQEPHREPQ